MTAQELLDVLLDLQKRKHNLKTISVLITENKVAKQRSTSSIIMEQWLIPLQDVKFDKTENLENLGVNLLPETKALVLGYIAKIDA